MKTLILAAIRCSLMFATAGAFSVAYPAKANLITNGGFETGDFTGWTLINGIIGSNCNVVGTVLGFSPHSGNFQATFAPGSGNVGISQTLTTTPSTIYTVDFWAANPSQLSFGGLLSVNWGGSTVFSHLFSLFGNWLHRVYV